MKPENDQDFAVFVVRSVIGVVAIGGMAMLAFWITGRPSVAWGTVALLVCLGVFGIVAGGRK